MTRGEVDELSPAIGLDGDDFADPKSLLAELQRIAGRRTDRLQQLTIDPYFTARRNIARHSIGLPDRIGHAQAAPQRITR